jgi:hypothetical protein
MAESETQKEFVGWLLQHGWELSTPEEVRALLARTREDIQAGNPEGNDGRVPRLLALEQGSPGDEDWAHLIEDWRNLEREVAITKGKARSLELAASFGDDEWEMPLYWKLHDAILDFKEGSSEGYLATVRGTRQLLQEAWAEMESKSQEIDGTTADSEVGQRLLQESFDFFYVALDEMEDAAEDGTGFGQALRCLETASRRMMAAQKLNEEILAS